jgi:hypothetical protein
VTLFHFYIFQSNSTYSIDCNKDSKSNIENKDFYFQTNHLKIQAAWTTGYIAGKHAGIKKEH